MRLHDRLRGLATASMAVALLALATAAGPVRAQAPEHGTPGAAADSAALTGDPTAEHTDTAQPEATHAEGTDAAPAGDTHAADAHGAAADAAEAHGGEQHGPDLGAILPLWSAVPFAGILLSIALFPLLAPHFWHRHFPKISAFWALLFALPFLAVFKGAALQEILHIYLIDYIPFIILLWSLFTISGGIYVRGKLSGSPEVNVVLLLIGTALASWIGTTGAAMVMIRPLLRANEWRKHKVHTVVFFIFLVANVGGSLTPLGDPPLFLGFLHGVPFFWVTKGILWEMLTVTVVLLAMYWVLDRRAYAKEGARPTEEPTADAPKDVRVEGVHNLLFLLGVMAGVLFSGSVKLGDLPVFGHVHVSVQNLIRDGFLILMGVLSLKTTQKKLREANEFSWFPILEVAYLFAGIFMTIIPALKILQAGEHGALAGLIAVVREPVHYFWVTGALSSFLDNAPTYLTFFNSALGSLGVPESAVPGMLGYLEPALRNQHFIEDLTAISAGAVFMGANTYIGNAPNFMVKSIAEEAGVPMPSFFGYMFRFSIPFLIPTFILVTLLFFR